jgi:hypothetical protein
MSNDNEIPERKSLTEIQVRHERDGWKDIVFIALAVLLVALSVGSVTSKAAGHPHEKQWVLTTNIDNPEIAK